MIILIDIFQMWPPASPHSSLLSACLTRPDLVSPKRLFGADLGLAASPGRFESPLSASPSPLGLDIEACADHKKGIYNCQFCGETFLNSRALKGRLGSL